MPMEMVSPPNHFCCSGFWRKRRFHSGEGSTPVLPFDVDAGGCQAELTQAGVRSMPMSLASL
jgi:hypothetical protein